jgi:hypothetical protein
MQSLASALASSRSIQSLSLKFPASSLSSDGEQRKNDSNKLLVLTPLLQSLPLFSHHLYELRLSTFLPTVSDQMLLLSFLSSSSSHLVFLSLENLHLQDKFFNSLTSLLNEEEGEEEDNNEVTRENTDRKCEEKKTSSSSSSSQLQQNQQKPQQQQTKKTKTKPNGCATLREISLSGNHPSFVAFASFERAFQLHLRRSRRRLRSSSLVTVIPEQKEEDGDDETRSIPLTSPVAVGSLFITETQCCGFIRATTEKFKKNEQDENQDDDDFKIRTPDEEDESLSASSTFPSLRLDLLLPLLKGEQSVCDCILAYDRMFPLLLSFVSFSFSFCWLLLWFLVRSLRPDCFFFFPTFRDGYSD